MSANMTEWRQAGQRLLQLGLDQQDLNALRRQGFIAREYRERDGRWRGPYYKLRWRRNNRQRVRYLGSNMTLVDDVRDALAC